MTQNDAEWRLNMEESAQGMDLFEAPGRDIQSSEAREDAAEFTAGEDEESKSTERVEKVRLYRHSLSGAMTTLESVVAGPAGAAGWNEAVGAALDELQVALDEHVTVTEGPEGILVEIFDIAPRLAAEIGLIKAEHEGLIESLDRAKLTLEGYVEMGQGDPDPVRRRVMTVLGRLSLHRQRGADLIYEAYNVDIATAD